MENKYDLESMIETFENHAKSAEERRKIDLQREKESGEKWEWLRDDFNISKALLSICKELKELKNGK
jgi:hypothetical protein